MQLNPQVDGALALAMAHANLDVCDRYLATRALVEALRKNAYFEIEQVVRTPGELSRRVRSNVQLTHAADGRAIGGKLTIERDGDPIFEWTLAQHDSPYLTPPDAGNDRVFVVTNSALTSIMLHAAAIDRLIGDAPASEAVRLSCGKISSNAQRAWQALCAGAEG